MYAYLFIISAAWTFQFIPTLVIALVAVAFLGMLVQNRIVVKRVRSRLAETDFTSKMMEQAVKINASNVVRFAIHEGIIEQLYGSIFPTRALTVEEWKSHVHPDDIEETLRRFRRMMAGKTLRDDFFYRWNFDFNGDQPLWGYMHNVSVVEMTPGTNIPQSIISTLHDETELREQELREEELTDKYRQVFEHSIIGLSFYSPEGWLLDANKEMRDICHFDSDTWDEHFSTTNLFEAMPFNELLDKYNIEELWCCSQSIVPERGIHDYLEIHLHPICDDEGQLVYIALAVRNITEERQMYLQAKENDIQIQKVNEEIMRYEEELRYMMEACDMRAWRASFAERKVRFFKGLGTLERELSFDEMERVFINETEALRLAFQDPYTNFNHAMTTIAETRPVFHEGQKPQWNQINSIPVYDDSGQLTGAFGLIRNISGMMEKQEQLKRETERANDSGRLKSVFLANMTHEIRTPLNAIVGFTDLLQTIESPDDKREMIRVIHNNCDMLLRLINDILVLSNMDANAMEIVPHDIDASRDFEELAKTLGQRVQEPGVEFQTDNPYEVFQTRLDSDRVNQVLTNFVTNAVKYTHKGHIRIGYRQEERQGKQGLYIYCEDTGSGIPKDKHAAIFERFVKLNDYVQGTGLGLPICKAIVEKCGGEIGLESEVGQGSLFWFWIPVEIREIKEKPVAS
jgi:signal transduction histidine kinase/PAS domain-containing protein